MLDNFRMPQYANCNLIFFMIVISLPSGVRTFQFLLKNSIIRFLPFAMIFLMIPDLSRAQEVKLELQTCLKFDTLFSTKQGCYVLDTKTKQQKTVIQIGVGINVNAGNVIIGGGGSSMLIVTVEHPMTGNSTQDLEKAVKRVEEELKKPDRQQKILKMYKDAHGALPNPASLNLKITPLKQIPVSDLPDKVKKKISESLPA